MLTTWLRPLEVNFGIARSEGPNIKFNFIASITAAVLVCKIVYDLTSAAGNLFVKGYNKLSDIKKIEWSDRGISTFHAIVISVVSIYLLLISDLFDEGSYKELIIRRRSSFSDTALGMSFGYFLSDLAVILWHFPALGGKEYALHHGLAMLSLFCSLISGQGFVYTLMLLSTESTTPFVNLRWYLDVLGKKNSKLYIFNGIALFLGWLVARILLFVYFFYHLYWHYNEVKTMFPLAFGCCIMAPPVLGVMNLIWFFKIAKGIVKALSKARFSD